MAAAAVSRGEGARRARCGGVRAGVFGTPRRCSPWRRCGRRRGAGQSTLGRGCGRGRAHLDALSATKSRRRRGDPAACAPSGRAREQLERLAPGAARRGGRTARAARRAVRQQASVGRIHSPRAVTWHVCAARAQCSREEGRAGCWKAHSAAQSAERGVGGGRARAPQRSITSGGVNASYRVKLLIAHSAGRPDARSERRPVVILRVE